MRARTLAVAALVLLSLTGCAATGPVFTDSEAREVLYGQTTQAALDAEDLVPANNTIATDSVAKYVAGTVAGSDVVFDPAECADSARLLILAGADADSADTFYALPALTSGTTAIHVKARLFDSPADASSFVKDFEAATVACSDFSTTESGKTTEVSNAVSESGDAGFRLDTIAVSAYRTYVVQNGNLVLAIQGNADTSTDTDLVSATADLYRTALEKN